MCQDCEKKKAARRAANKDAKAVAVTPNARPTKLSADERKNRVDRLIERLRAARPHSKLQEATPKMVEQRLAEYAESAHKLTDEQLESFENEEVFDILSDILGMSALGYEILKAERRIASKK